MGHFSCCQPWFSGHLLTYILFHRLDFRKNVSFEERCVSRKPCKFTFKVRFKACGRETNLPQTLYFSTFLATPVRPIGPKGSLSHLGRPWSGPKPSILRYFWPPQCGPLAPKGSLATLPAPGAAENLASLDMCGQPSAAHCPQGTP